MTAKDCSEINTSASPTSMIKIVSGIKLIVKKGVIIVAFFESEIVQGEAKGLFQDYQSLMELGGGYGKFDREGKKLFIEKMEEILDRYRIFMKRFELSDDFMAQMTMKQLQTHLGNFGITPLQMFDQMQSTLERMKSELNG
jgi:Domain of unknown function (DUF1825)